MNIKLKLKGMIAASMGFTQKTMDIPEGQCVKDFLTCLNLPVDASWVLVTVNGKSAERDGKLTLNDEVCIYPLGGGG
jgi:sulfur carrier protein ThiS